MATVEYIRVFEDGSGVPAVVSYGRYKFACDTLGEVRMHLIAPVYGSRVENKIAVAACRKVYIAARDAKVDADWLRRNSEMYADVVQAAR